jgi:hypothetical protein
MYPTQGATGYALFSPTATALARGEHLRAAVSPRLPHGAGLRDGHEPAVIPAGATGRWPWGRHRAEPWPARRGLLLRGHHLQHALSSPGHGSIPAHFVAEPGAGHRAAGGAATLCARVSARCPAHPSRRFVSAAQRVRLRDLGVRGDHPACRVRVAPRLGNCQCARPRLRRTLRTSWS